MSLLRSLLFFLGAAVAAALAVLCLWVDIRVFGNDIPEVSLTEVVQESVLAVIVLVHLLLARKYAHLRYSNILIGGFFLAMLIRNWMACLIYSPTAAGCGLPCWPPRGRCCCRCAICVRPCRSWRSIPAPRITG